MINIKNINKILIMELWGIGDIVLVSGVPGALKKFNPNIRIVLLGKEHAKTVLSDNLHVDQFINYDFPWTRLKRKYWLWQWDWIRLFRLIILLRAKKFDLIIDARGDIRNNFLSFLIGAKSRVGYDWGGGGYFLTDIVKSDRSKMHRVDAWRKLLEYVGIERLNVEPIVKISKNEDAWADDFLQTRGIDNNSLLVGIHPGARSKTRRWPLDRFAKVADFIISGYGAKVIVFIDPDDLGKDIPIRGPHVLMKLPLRQLISVLSKVNLFICNDSGPMHLAAALGVPLVSVFGPTEPRWFGPYGQNDAVIINENFLCRPCFDNCYLKNNPCLYSIDVGQVNKVVKRSLDRFINHA